MRSKVAIVTGGASGIGKAVVERLVRDGWAVAIADIDGKAGAAVAQTAAAAGGDAIFIATDVSDEAAVAAMVARTEEKFGRLDGAVNCAGIPQNGQAVHEMDVEHWDRLSAVNLRGMFLCIKHEVRAMWNEGGAIVAVSSPAGTKALPNSAAYCATKSGIDGLVRAAAVDCAKRNIRINALLPGATLTPLAKEAAAKDPALLAAGNWPLGRWAEPEEIAAAAAWMISPDATFMTGASIAVDGGMTA